MNDCIIKWIKKEDLKDAELLLGIPGIGSVANLSADYLIKKMKFELICRIESNYLPNIALITPESTLMLPSFDLYLSKIKSRKIAILKSNYAPVSEHFNYKLADFLAKFLKKLKIKRAFTIAGIAYKEMPKKILIHCATNNALLKKALEKKGIVFDGNKSVNLIIGTAGLLAIELDKNKVPCACILASTFAHPQHLGIKESREVIGFFNDFLKLNLDLSDMDREIKKINTELKKIQLKSQDNDESSHKISRYIG